MTHLDEESFAKLAEEVQEEWEKTTWRGTERVRKVHTKKPFTLTTALFLTLFWMAHYPTLSHVINLLFSPQNTPLSFEKDDNFNFEKTER